MPYEQNEGNEKRRDVTIIETKLRLPADFNRRRGY
jgi:hypothetical protein